MITLVHVLGSLWLLAIAAAPVELAAGLVLVGGLVLINLIYRAVKSL